MNLILRDAVHGSWCNSKVFRISCWACGEEVWYFTCSCGCKILFNDLGPPWPLHKNSCYRWIMNEYGISEEDTRKIIIGALKDEREPIVCIDELFQNIVIKQKDWNSPIAKAIIQNKEKYFGTGIVREVIKDVNWIKRFNIDSGSIAEKLMIKEFGEKQWGQVTIHEYEISNQIYSSYTAFIHSTELSGIKNGLSVEFSVKGISILEKYEFMIIEDINALNF